MQRCWEKVQGGGREPYRVGAGPLRLGVRPLLPAFLFLLLQL